MAATDVSEKPADGVVPSHDKSSEDLVPPSDEKPSEGAASSSSPAAESKAPKAKVRSHPHDTHTLQSII